MFVVHHRIATRNIKLIINLYNYCVSRHYPSFFFYLRKPQSFGHWILSPSSVEPTQLGPADRAIPHLQT
jgi:hypothetical protein